MSDPRCKCPMAISMTGDGCRYCQPQDHIDRMGEWLDEEREEIDRLQAENEALRARVAGLETMVKVFRGCIETGVFLESLSPCHHKIIELVGGRDD